MPVFNAAFPVISGQEEAARILAKDVAGPRRDGFVAMQSDCDISRESWSLQETPGGSFLLVWFDGDVAKTFGHLATSDRDFEVWFRKQILDITGVDLSQAPAGPPPELLLDWTA